MDRQSKLSNPKSPREQCNDNVFATTECFDQSGRISVSTSVGCSFTLRDRTSVQNSQKGTERAFPASAEAGWLRAAQTGWCWPRNGFSSSTPPRPLHQGCCRDILLMSRPPLLIRGGENANDIFAHATRLKSSASLHSQCMLRYELSTAYLRNW